MIYCVYDLLVALVFFFFFYPATLYQSWKTGKLYPSFSARLGLDIPDPQGHPVIWIHAVSVGEVKAAQPFVAKLRTSHPDSFLLITTASVTGQEEAKRSLPQANAYRYLPLDFSFTMKRWVNALKPKDLYFIEGDIWYHLIHYVKESGGKVHLISGKMSELSARRFLFFKPLAQKLFNHFDEISVQNEEYRLRFAPLVTAIQPTIGGNLKFLQTPKPVDLPSLHAKWGPGPWITISSTHHPEEELLLDALKPLLSQVRIFLAPRHPERSDAVAALLEAKGIPFCRIDRPDDSRLVLVDRMGELPACYSLSVAAIVGGSFVPGIGGHNILEPGLYNCPAFFGPYMENQKDLVRIVLENKKGTQIELNGVDRIFDRTHDRIENSR